MRLTETLKQIFGTADTRRLGPAGWIAMVAMLGFLVVAAWYAVDAWGQLAGVGISPAGWVFLSLGIVVTLAMGAGLMGLVFYSSRKGKDF
jgi:hypothetical protein